MSRFGPSPRRPGRRYVIIESVTQEVVGALRHLRGMVRVETSDMLYGPTRWTTTPTPAIWRRAATCTWTIQHGRKLDCDHATYNVNTDQGKFYVVTGSSLPRIHSNPGTLTTTNPFI